MSGMKELMEKIKTDVAVREEQVRAKRALLDAAFKELASVQPHPLNNDFVANVLGVRVKEMNVAEEVKLTCRFNFAVLIDEWLCVGVHLCNKTIWTCTVNCQFVSESAASPFLDTNTTIFDSLNVTKFIPCESERLVVSACQSGVLLDGCLELVVECKLIDDPPTYTSNLNSSLRIALPKSCIHNALFSFPIFLPIRSLYLRNITDINMEDAERLYQCLCVTCFSEHIEMTPNEIIAMLNRLSAFTNVDFGDWSLITGNLNTQWQGVTIFCSSNTISSIPSGCHIFVRRACDLMRVKRSLYS